MAMTQSEFARSLGLHPSAVNHMKAKKQIAMTPDGLVDTDHPLTKERAKRCVEYKTKNPKGMLVQRQKQERALQAAALQANTYREIANVEPVAAAVVVSDTDVEQFNASLADWQIAKIKAQTALTNANLAEKLKQVVHRDLVDSVFGRLGGALSDHLLTMGDRLSADVAALVGTTDPAVVTEVKRLINMDVTRSLRAVQAVIVDYYEKELEV
jgi:hypothetical protein